MRVVLLGPQGVGKGTYGNLLSEKYDLPLISMGDLLRDEVKQDTEAGKHAEEYMNNGELVPDRVVLEVLNERLGRDDCKEGFFLDGYPRTLEQAKKFQDIGHVDKVIQFYAEDNVLMERLGGRRICKECQAVYHIKNVPPKVEGICDKCGGELYQRKDDQPDAIRERLKIYREMIKPIVDFYGETLKKIDAGRPFEKSQEVVEECSEWLES